VSEKKHECDAEMDIFVIHGSRDNPGIDDLIDWRSLTPIKLIDLIKMQMKYLI